jgi:hypothetical protein
MKFFEQLEVSNSIVGKVAKEKSALTCLVCYDAGTKIQISGTLLC